MHRTGNAPPQPVRGGGGCLPFSLVGVLLLVLATIAFFALWIVLEMALGPYEGRIYPNVYVVGVDLGGLAPDAAALRLAGAEAGYGGEEYDGWTYEGGAVVLRDGAQSWSLPWSEIGLRLDPLATAQVAYNVGRADASPLTLLRLWLGRQDVAPVLTIDTAMARAALEQLAPQVSQPPVDATLRLENGQLVTVPGQAGRVLDVAVTLDNLVNVVSRLGPEEEVALTFQLVPPAVIDAAPAQAQAEQMLSREIRLVADEVLSGEQFSWTVGRAAIGGWLRVEQAADGSLRVVADRAAVWQTLQGLAVDMGEGRGFREEAADQVLEALEAGGGTVSLYITHPARSYTIEFGDRLSSIAARFGMPPGLIAEANSGVDLNWLQVGQQIVIPSQDILTPYTPVPGRRVVISIPEQRMRVYENGQLLYEWVVSTGIDSSPTNTGVFQVLSMEEEAYASQWDLWMPNFIAIYRAGGEVYNGIHALPILANGQRLWAGSLGSPASFGCIILGIDEAQTLYDWVEVGVVVVIVI